MPSNSPTVKPETVRGAGTLYIVATPIGNKDDITLRALNVLRKVNLIAAEDTRKTRRFLARHDIKNSFVSYHEHNEDRRTPKLIDKLVNGSSIALVSSAGTPSISDPGYRLIQTAISKNINVIPIPGVSAVTAALSVAGLPTDTYVFAGFLSKRKSKRLKQITNLAAAQRTIIFYESPKRILAMVEEIIASMGDRQAVLAREMTKLHEEFVRGSLLEILDILKQRSEIKGECTLLVTSRGARDKVSWKTVQKEISSALNLNREKVSELAKRLAKKYQIPRKKIYDEALRLRGS
jgi:16S rRNA (cytidine1402-2'-O)-methyltransferase